MEHLSKTIQVQENKIKELQNTNTDFVENYKHKNLIINVDSQLEVLNQIIKQKEDEVATQKTKIVEYEESIKVYKENTEQNESKKNFSETLKTKIEKAIGREASLLKKVNELQTSFSNSSEREMSIGKQLRELKHEREAGLNRENELKSKNKELENQQQSNSKMIEQFKADVDEMKHRIEG